MAIRTILQRAIPCVLVIFLAGCGSAPRHLARAPLMIELPQAIIDACRTAQGIKEGERVVRFWATFDDVLWLKAGPEVRPVVFGPAFIELGPLWLPLAMGRPGAERAWLDSAQKATTRTNITRLSDYQLALMRCYFGGNGPEGLDVARITTAFEELALSTHSKGQDYVDGLRRMSALQAWMQWAAFSEACLETGLILPKQDIAAWRLVRRLVLRAVLLDAHHDPVESERRRGLVPPGLPGTEMADIRRFSDEISEDSVRRALHSLQATMAANPNAYPANMPPIKK